VILSADFFADPDMGQIQAAADWEIYTATPSNLVWSSYGTTGSTLLTKRLSNGAFTGFSCRLEPAPLPHRLPLAHPPPGQPRRNQRMGVVGLRYFNTRPPVISSHPQSMVASPAKPAA
jgi:hypothetical protein